MEPLKYAEMFAALGSEQRLAILRKLINAGENGLTVGDLQAKVQIPSSTLSHHLEKLRQEDLVIVRRDCQRLVHSVNVASIEELVSFLKDRCCKKEGRKKS